MRLAQVENPLLPRELNPTTGELGVLRLNQVLTTIVGVFFIVGVLFFFFVFIIGGIRWIVSGGDKTQIESARSTILNALIGLVVLFALFAILQVIETLFHISILQINFGALKIN